jgi:hypothetical protein
MKDLFHVKAAAGMIAILLVGSFFGNRIDTVKEDEIFYRWLVSAASLTRIGESLAPETSSETQISLEIPVEPTFEDPSEESPDEKPDELPEVETVDPELAPMDDVIFAEVIRLSDAFLEHIEPQDEEDDYNENGDPFSKLLLAARQGKDDDIWAFATAPEHRELKQKFHSYRNAGQIASAGEQLDASSFYHENAQVEGVGLTSLFLGFRKLSANFMWLQVDKFYHAGELHRMVPLMRACVTMDPTFIDAYLLGSWHLAYNITAKLEDTPEPLKKLFPQYGKRLGLKEIWYYRGVEFLKDGIKKNPRDYRLYFDLGYGIFETKLEDHPNAVKYLDEATRYRHDQWVPRMLYRSLYLNGEYEKAIAGWEDYLSPENFPNNLAGQRFLRINRGELADAIAEDALDCKKEAEKALEFYQSQNDQVKAAEVAEYIEELTDLIQSETIKANKIWNELSVDSEDSIAMGKLSRQKALDLVEQDRKFEAIAELKYARWQYGSFFDEANELLIKIKQDHGIDLSESEKKQVAREADAAKYLKESDKPPEIRRVDCRFPSPTEIPIEEDDI